jgi:hypothetical protein
MSESTRKTKEPDASNALALLEDALVILDQLEMPADIGAHLDLVICRLRERLGTSAPRPGGPDAF